MGESPATEEAFIIERWRREAGAGASLKLIPLGALRAHVDDLMRAVASLSVALETPLSRFTTLKGAIEIVRRADPSIEVVLDQVTRLGEIIEARLATARPEVRR